MRYKGFVFAFVLVFLIRVVPVQEARAEEGYNLGEALEIIGLTYDTSNTALDDFVCGGYKNVAKNFVIFRNRSDGEYFYNILFFNDDSYRFSGGDYSTPERYSQYLLRSSSSYSSVNYYYFNSRVSGGKFVFSSMKNAGQDYFAFKLYAGSSIEYSNFGFKRLSSYVTDIPYNSVFTESYTHAHAYTPRGKAATCTEDGGTWERCTCGDIRNKIAIPALDHTWISKEEDATCIKDGRTYDECSVCSAIQNEVIVPTSGHGSTVYEVTQQPTLEEEGIFVETCSVCGEVVKTGAVPLLTPTPAPTLPPSPELVSQVSDFFLFYVMIMTLFQSFPLNLFVVACLLCVAVILFRRSKNEAGSK